MEVVITGLGAVTPLGHDVDTFWHSIVQGQSGIHSIEGFDSLPLKIKIAAQIRAFDGNNVLPEKLLPLLDRHSQFALVAAKQAVNDAGLTGEELAKAASIIGSGCGGKETDEITYTQLYKEGRKRVSPLTIPRGMPSAAASQVSMQLGTQGPCFTVSSACASANHAIAQAAMMIRQGIVDVAIAGASDAPFTFGLLKAWEAVRVVSSDNCRPFSVDRSGMVLGEGAGVVVLESRRHAEARNAQIYAALAGFGMSSDAGHITDPSVAGAEKAMLAAMADAGINRDEIGYVNAHGTGTKANDRSETQALHRVFAGEASKLMVSSTKSMHGHALGASGAMELICTVMAIREGTIPPTANYSAPDPECDLDYVPNSAREISVDGALSNSFAFGGLNCVLVVKSFR